MNGKGKRKGKKGTGKGRTNAPVSRARMSEPVLPISTRARTTEVLLVTSRAMRTRAEPSTDIDNARKVLYDALKGIAFEDDARIFRDSAERMEPDGEARVVVTVAPIVRVCPQAGLELVA